MTIKTLISATLVALSFAAAATPAHSAEKLKVMLEWFVNPDHAPLVIAKELGYFDKAGLEIELIPPADPSSVPRLIAAGQADIGIHYQPSLYLDHQAGLPLKRFGTLVETPLNTVTVLKDGPIQDLRDLKGKTVGFSVSGFEDAMLGQMLRSVGLSLTDVTLVNVNFALSQSLLSGQVDATIGGFRNFELTQIELEGGTAKAFYPEENAVPIYDELIFIAAKGTLEKPELEQFLRAIEQATIYLTNRPEDAWQLFIKAYPNLNDALNKRAFTDTLPRFAKRPAALDHGRYERFGAFMKDSGLIPSIPSVEELAVELK